MGASVHLFLVSSENFTTLALVWYGSILFTATQGLCCTRDDLPKTKPLLHPNSNHLSSLVADNFDRQLALTKSAKRGRPQTQTTCFHIHCPNATTNPTLVCLVTQRHLQTLEPWTKLLNHPSCKWRARSVHSTWAFPALRRTQVAIRTWHSMQASAGQRPAKKVKRL